MAVGPAELMGQQKTSFLSITTAISPILGTLFSAMTLQKHTAKTDILLSK